MWPGFRWLIWDLASKGMNIWALLKLGHLLICLRLLVSDECALLRSCLSPETCCFSRMRIQLCQSVTCCHWFFLHSGSWCTLAAFNKRYPEENTIVFCVVTPYSLVGLYPNSASAYTVLNITTECLYRTAWHTWQKGCQTRSTQHMFQYKY